MEFSSSFSFWMTPRFGHSFSMPASPHLSLTIIQYLTGQAESDYQKLSCAYPVTPYPTQMPGNFLATRNSPRLRLSLAILPDLVPIFLVSCKNIVGIILSQEYVDECTLFFFKCFTTLNILRILLSLPSSS